MASTQRIRLSCTFVLILSTSFLTVSQKCESDGLYVIRSKGTHGFVLDATEVEQVRIQQFTGDDTQLWKFQPAGRPGLYYIINEHHGQALDYNVYEDGLLHVVVNELQNTTQQRWSFDSKGTIVNAAVGKNVAIHNADFVAGKHIMLMDETRCICQVFILQKKI